MSKDYLIEARNLALQCIPDAIKTLEEIMQNESVNPMTRVRAASTLQKFISESREQERKNQ